MKFFQCMLVGTLVAAAVHAADDKKKDVDKDKIVGIWELVQGNPLQLPRGLYKEASTWQFSKDGKVVVTVKSTFELPPEAPKGASLDLVQSGTYKLDGNKIKINLKRNEAVNGQTAEIVLGGKRMGEAIRFDAVITKLTEKELELKGKGGKVNRFKKKESNKGSA